MNPQSVHYEDGERAVRVIVKMSELPGEAPSIAFPLMRKLADQYAAQRGSVVTGETNPATRASLGVDGWTIETSYSLAPINRDA